MREDIKKELDKLNDEQLKKIADFIAFLEFQSRQGALSVPFWQRAKPSDRAREFREWVSQLPKDSPSLRDEAFSRNSIYESGISGITVTHPQDLTRFETDRL